MLPIARRNKIKELITEKKSVTVAELTKLFKVTEETIRRDLKQLEEEGFLNRTYGGAYISEGVQNDVDITLREHIHVEGKQKIASQCLPFIHSGDSIFLDASTTSVVLASMLQGKKITVVTNSIKIVNTLVDNPDIDLVVIGGTLAKSSLSNVGKTAEYHLNHYFFDTAFISCRSVSRQHGLTDSNEQQAAMRKLAAEHANNVFLIADYTKFDKTSFTRIGGFDLVDTIVVDQKLSAEWHQFLEEKQITLIECD
ncbi:transcriptional regulator, DeoR family [Caldalkalibacillus thermarum TA2.A1]|uniref:DeoR/GlpR family DNA-binding transcription regulator n=1 Tax=Caldalkalibacillus thermarum (strain TA2.A1) TaxID=986075 RepID=F5L8G8_CALTT|nr:DeoR/GlpR family DNA-binding transcription regulator [Caldalkalibacillus thermarum]EGL82401.1 transcriptional regulator, DeoR family [Caldalkalibacillus thermarum TA2.A1]QZT34277.1 DeoR/GlpR family DNA-binding transcription regulator [Caldalkalibacillus thermarum TA2.A1]